MKYPTLCDITDKMSTTISDILSVIDKRHLMSVLKTDVKRLTYILSQDKEFVDMVTKYHSIVMMARTDINKCAENIVSKLPDNVELINMAGNERRSYVHYCNTIIKEHELPRSVHDKLRTLYKSVPDDVLYNTFIMNIVDIYSDQYKRTVLVTPLSTYRTTKIRQMIKDIVSDPVGWLCSLEKHQQVPIDFGGYTLLSL